MIVPNLIVSDMAKSISFYRDVIGMRVMMCLNADNQMVDDTDSGTVVFSTLELDGAQLMIQTRKFLEAHLPDATASGKPSFTGTIYFRNGSPEDVLRRASAPSVISDMETTWYGMKELYLADPDKYVICVARRDETASVSV